MAKQDGRGLREDAVVRGRAGEESGSFSPLSEAGSSKRQCSPHGRFAGHPGAQLT